MGPDCVLTNPAEGVGNSAGNEWPGPALRLMPVITKSLASAILLACAVGVAAEPPWRKDLSDPAPGAHPGLAPVRLEYRLSWNGTLDAGAITFVFGKPDPKHPDAYAARALGGSRGLAKRLFDYRHDFTALLDPATLRPRTFAGTEDGDDTQTITRNTFGAAGVRSRETTRDPVSGREFASEREFAFQPAFDMFSAMLLIRSKPLAAGDHVTLVIHPFHTPYLLDTTVVAREAHDGRAAIRLDVNLRKIAPDLSLQPYAKLKRASLWLSDDPERIPLDLRTEVFIGDVRMTLVRSTPLR